MSTQLINLHFRYCVAMSFLIFLTLGVELETLGQEHSVKPLPNAHAHNDYYHDRPLFDALDNGFCNIEADIYIVGKELYVAHDPDELKQKRKLTELYLDPLLKRTRAHGGRVYPNGPTVTLLIDIKRDGEKVFPVLRDTLQKYREMLSCNENGRFKQGAVHIVISGDRPKKLIAADNDRLMGIDGRVSDLSSDMPADLMPLISDRWGSHFKWRGEGPIPSAEKEKLYKYVAQAHKKGRKVRFWATPESTKVWKVLVDAKVDMINTDKLEELRMFLSDKDYDKGN